jgi:hypothetical protein
MTPNRSPGETNAPLFLLGWLTLCHFILDVSIIKALLIVVIVFDTFVLAAQ